MIEAVIISVDLEHARQLGVNFALVDNLGTALGEIGSGTSLNNNVGFNPTQLLTTAGKIAGAAADPTGLASATNGAKFGFVANNVTGFIQALETIGSTKILASPRILVLNKQRAEIQLGTRLGFQTFSQNFTSTIQQVQFLNTGTLLRIRPFISQDGMIRMEIHPERSSGSVTNNIPNQQTAELTTNVMVPDGATLVIGGLMEDEDDFQLQGLPGLSRLPGARLSLRLPPEERRAARAGRPADAPHLVARTGNAPHGRSQFWPAQARIPAAGESATAANPAPARAPVPAHRSVAGSTVPPAAPRLDRDQRGGHARVRTQRRDSRSAPSVKAPGAGTAAAAAALHEQEPRLPAAPEKASSARSWQRITGRNDSKSRDQARPGSARTSAAMPRSNLAAGSRLSPADPPRRTSSSGCRATERTAASAVPWHRQAAPRVPRTLPRDDNGCFARRPRRQRGEQVRRVAAMRQAGTSWQTANLCVDRAVYYGSARFDKALWWANRSKCDGPTSSPPGITCHPLSSRYQVDAGSHRGLRSPRFSARLAAAEPQSGDGGRHGSGVAAAVDRVAGFDDGPSSALALRPSFRRNHGRRLDARTACSDRRAVGLVAGAAVAIAPANDEIGRSQPRENAED